MFPQRAIIANVILVMKTKVIAIIQIHRPVLRAHKHKTPIWVVTGKCQLRELLDIFAILNLTLTPVNILR